MIHVRDVYCLISGTFLTTCEAAHIVPKSRPDVSTIDRSHILEERVVAAPELRLIGCCLSHGYTGLSRNTGPTGKRASW
jgi:hypothetical protein